MSREPSNSLHNFWREREEPPAPPPEPPRLGRGKNVRLRSPLKDAAFAKWTSSTEALTDDEKKLLRGYRLAGGSGPEVESAERKRLEEEVKEGR